METNLVYQTVSAALKAHENPPVTEWIIAVSSGLGALGVIFIVWQAMTMKKQLIAMVSQTQMMGHQVRLMNEEMVNAHELARRQRANDLMMEWSKGISKHGSITRQFIEKLDKNQCNALANQEPFTISVALESFFSKCLVQATQAEDKDIIKNASGVIEVTKAQASILRSGMVGYLNLLESILSARHYGIADRDMIKEQFAYLYDEKEGHFMLNGYRQALGVKKLPSIHAFYLELKEDAEAKGGGKPQIASS